MTFWSVLRPPTFCLVAHKKYVPPVGTKEMAFVLSSWHARSMENSEALENWKRGVRVQASHCGSVQDRGGVFRVYKRAPRLLGWFHECPSLEATLTYYMGGQ